MWGGVCVCVGGVCVCRVCVWGGVYVWGCMCVGVYVCGGCMCVGGVYVCVGCVCGGVYVCMCGHVWGSGGDWVIGPEGVFVHDQRYP